VPGDRDQGGTGQFLYYFPEVGGQVREDFFFGVFFSHMPMHMRICRRMSLKKLKKKNLRNAHAHGMLAHVHGMLAHVHDSCACAHAGALSLCR
jgi:hypothetical protein